jgi:hypothetical protein
MNRKDNYGSQRHMYKKADHLIRKQRKHVTITRVILCTPARVRDFSILRNVQTGCVAHSAGVTLLARVKRPGSEDDDLPLTTVEVKNEWNYTSTPPVCLRGV